MQILSNSPILLPKMQFILPKAVNIPCITPNLCKIKEKMRSQNERKRIFDIIRLKTQVFPLHRRKFRGKNRRGAPQTEQPSAQPELSRIRREKAT